MIKSHGTGLNFFLNGFLIFPEFSFQKKPQDYFSHSIKTLNSVKIFECRNFFPWKTTKSHQGPRIVIKSGVFFFLRENMPQYYKMHSGVSLLVVPSKCIRHCYWAPKSHWHCLKTVSGLKIHCSTNIAYILQTGNFYPF